MFLPPSIFKILTNFDDAFLTKSLELGGILNLNIFDQLMGKYDIYFWLLSGGINLKPTVYQPTCTQHSICMQECSSQGLCTVSTHPSTSLWTLSTALQSTGLLSTGLQSTSLQSTELLSTGILSTGHQRPLDYCPLHFSPLHYSPLDYLLLDTTLQSTKPQYNWCYKHITVNCQLDTPWSPIPDGHCRY